MLEGKVWWRKNTGMFQSLGTSGAPSFISECASIFTLDQNTSCSVVSREALLLWNVLMFCFLWYSKHPAAGVCLPDAVGASPRFKPRCCAAGEFSKLPSSCGFLKSLLTLNVKEIWVSEQNPCSGLMVSDGSDSALVGPEPFLTSNSWSEEK